MVLVVGGDHLGSIAENLRGLGYGEVVHVTGRNERRLDIPAGTRLILVLVDYVNHNLARWVKDQAKAQGIPAVFTRRSWSSVCRSLQNCGLPCIHAETCPRSSRKTAVG